MQKSLQRLWDSFEEFALIGFFPLCTVPHYTPPQFLVLGSHRVRLNWPDRKRFKNWEIVIFRPPRTKLTLKREKYSREFLRFFIRAFLIVQIWSGTAVGFFTVVVECLFGLVVAARSRNTQISLRLSYTF